ncbi:MAG TPA: hypothetical protein VIY56_18775 [Vicinamibacterales bacterium]
MYTPLLLVHSWLRWAVLIAGVLAVARALAGVRTRRPFTPVDSAAARRLVIALDVQLLLGLVLHVWASPFTTEAFGDLGATMRNAPLRFFVVEHPFGMLAAVALVHIGSARLKKRTESAARHKTALVFFGLALLIIVLSIPWPGLPAGRPLFRGL